MNATSTGLAISDTIALTIGIDEDGDLNPTLTINDTAHDLGFAHAATTTSPSPWGGHQVTEADDRDHYLSDAARLIEQFGAADEVWSSADDGYLRAGRWVMTWRSTFGTWDHVQCDSIDHARQVLATWVEATLANYVDAAR